MKIVIVGGGAHRVLGILRSALALPGVLNGGTIDLFDINTSRAEAMGRMLLKTPEQNGSGCAIKWSASLEEALSGADVVGAIMPAISPAAYWNSTDICLRNGFISSDNVSPTGAMCGIRIAPVLLHLAGQMEKYCPGAWLVNFVNPAGVLSGMINNHTKIRTLGVCAGFTNHLWDIPRIFGKDEEVATLNVTAAGVNHLSYILEGTWEGGDLFSALAKAADKDWKFGTLQPWWNEFSRNNIRTSVERLVRLWRQFGVLVFSTESDGMAHLFYDEAVEDERRKRAACDPSKIMETQARNRLNAERKFFGLLDQNLDTEFWNEHWKIDPTFCRVDEDIFVRIFSALAGLGEVTLATSRLNQGAIAGIKDRHVVEYTHTMFRNEITHKGPFDIPDVVHGLTASLASHQTLLGDALAEGDPEALAKALLCYPVKPYSRESSVLFGELLEENSNDISPVFRQAQQFLRAS